MRLYGNFKFAFNQLAREDNEQEFRAALREVQEKSEDEFLVRDKFNIEEIEEEDRHLLGYVSGAHIDNLGSSIRLLEGLEAQVHRMPEVLGNLPQVERDKFQAVLREEKVDLDLGLRPREKVLIIAKLLLSSLSTELPVYLDLSTVHAAVPCPTFPAKSLQVRDSPRPKALPRE